MTKHSSDPTPCPTPLCFKGWVNFNNLLWRGMGVGGGESEKLKKREWKYGAWAGHHKGGGRGGGGPNCVLSYTLRSATIILWKKFILSCLKMNLKIPHKLRQPGDIFAKGFEHLKIHWQIFLTNSNGWTGKTTLLIFVWTCLFSGLFA